MFIEKSHDEVYGCLKGGSRNSGGKRLAISMVKEAWLSEKKEAKERKGRSPTTEVPRKPETTSHKHAIYRSPFLNAKVRQITERSSINKTRLEEACTVTMHKRCSAVLLNKLPSREKDPGSFTISCDIGHLHINNALADLGASISLMPYTMYEELSLGEPKPTRMSLELADRSIQYPRGIAKNVLIKIDKFVLPIDFVILDMQEDSKIPIILGRPFLATTQAMIDVFNKNITLRVGNEEVIFDVAQSIKRPPAEDNECYGIDFLNTAIHSKAQELLEDDQLDSFLVSNLEESINLSDLESCDKTEYITPIRRIEEVLEKRKGAIAWKMSDIKGISSSFCTHKILMEESFKPAIQPQRRLNLKVPDMVKNEIVKLLDSGLIYPISDSQWMLERLLGNKYYCFLDGFSGFFQIPIAPKDQEKTTFTCPYGTFAYRRMPFGLCNALATFQRCMTAIFHDMIEDFICEETNLVLNWEKCHFMVKEGIVLGHKIYGKGIEVDKAKIDMIAKLPYPSSVKGGRSFLGHAGFYRRGSLRTKNRREIQPIYYASKTLNDAQAHYTTTEKELLAVVFSFDKFRPYLILLKTIVYTDHSALKYSFSKQDAKPRLIRWVLLLQGFNIKIKDKKRAENLAAGHLSRLENLNMGEVAEDEIIDKFPDEHLMILKAKLNDEEPWYADYINYIARKVVPPKWTPKRRKRFFSQVRNYFLDEPFAFRLCPDNVMRRCVAGNKILEILAHYHSGPTRGHHSASVTGRKVYEAGFYWLGIFKDAKDYVMKCDACQKLGNILSRNKLPQNNIQVCEVFNVWGLDFMGPFLDSKGNKYILVAVDYVSKWFEAQALPTNDARVLVRFLKGLFSRFGVPKALISDRGTHFFTNRAIKRILERSDGYNLKDWSEKLNDALWAFRTTYKTPTGCTPFMVKQCNMDLTAAAKNRFMDLNELMKLRDGAYENTRSYKERTKRWHDGYAEIKNL
ncbi:reverse transcriptase domain-containing protein [Tanacetum coccineum]